MRGFSIGFLAGLAAGVAVALLLASPEPRPPAPPLPSPTPERAPPPVASLAPQSPPPKPAPVPGELTREAIAEIQFGGKRVVPPETIRKLLSSPDRRRRLLGVALAPASTGDHLPELLEATRDPDPDIRQRALRSIADTPRLRKGNESVIVRAFSDPDVWVRRTAAEAYPRLPPEYPGIVEAVLDSTTDPDLGYRDDVLRGIASLSWSPRIVDFALASLVAGDYPPYVLDVLCDTVILAGRGADLLDALPRSKVAQMIVETVLGNPDLERSVARVMPRLFALYSPYVEKYWAKLFDLALRTGHPDLVSELALDSERIDWIRILAIERVVKADESELAVVLVQSILRTEPPELREEVLNELPLEPPYRALVERAAREDPNEYIRAGQTERLAD